MDASLLRPSQPCLFGIVSGAGFRNQAVLQGKMRSRFSKRSSPSPAMCALPSRSASIRDGYQTAGKASGDHPQHTHGARALRHPVTIVTKSALVLRDMDLLADLAKDRLVSGDAEHHFAQQRDQTHTRASDGFPRSAARVVKHLSEAGIRTGIYRAGDTGNHRP